MTEEREENSLRLKVEKNSLEIESKGDQTKRISNALMDAISPFTGLLGAAGDELHYFRIARREKVLSTILRAREIRETHGIPHRKVSPKLLAPWLEYASLEDDSTSDISEMWARILATAPTEFDAQYAYFIDVLKKFGAKEALLLQSIGLQAQKRVGEAVSAPKTILTLFAVELWDHVVKQHSLNEPDVSGNDILNRINEFNNSKISTIDNGVIALMSFENSKRSISTAYITDFDQDRCPSVSIFQSLGLIHCYTLNFSFPDNGAPELVEGSCEICALTGVGRNLLDLVDPNRTFKDTELE